VKQKALEKEFGTYEASYCNLTRVLNVLKETYIGTYDSKKVKKWVMGEISLCLFHWVLVFRHSGTLNPCFVCMVHF
jgi:hypothetical protein